MIDVRDLTFTYAGAGAPAVRGLTFSVRPGEIFGFLGPSGAGKSTTQKILIGLLHGYQGSVQVRGREVASWTSEEYERIGVSFETPNHFLKLTALENLRYFAALYSGPTRPQQALLEAVGLAEEAGKPVGQFSKGMKGRLSVARSLLCEPELLFLDEPTVGLDPVNAQRIKDVIRQERAGGCTVFLTTHDMTLADELCDRVAFLMDGQIACIDSPRRLKLQHGEPTLRVEFRQHGAMANADFPLHGLAENTAFLSLLREHDVETMHSREAGLAEVFIRVTGRRLE